MEQMTYHEKMNIENTVRLRNVLSELPPFARDYFRAIEPTTSSKTRISYAYDLRIFFNYLIENNPMYKNYQIKDFTLDDLDRLESVDIEEYQEYLKLYDSDDKNRCKYGKRPCQENVLPAQLLQLLLQASGH